MRSSGRCSVCATRIRPLCAGSSAYGQIATFEQARQQAGISATLESGRTMSWATPVRSHVVVSMMARSITVERSVPALLALARVSGEGMGAALFLYQGFRGEPRRISLRAVSVARASTKWNDPGRVPWHDCP